MGAPRSGWATTVMNIFSHQKPRTSRQDTCLLLLLSLSLCLSVPVLAQQSVSQRSFYVSSSDISGAIVKIGATTKGRLPTLDGFVRQPDQPIERYSKGYFECAFQILPPVEGSTTVRVVAKVSAWYSDPDPNQSGYRVLSSNGRLEADALDRLAEVLPASASDGKPFRPPAPAPTPTPSSTAPPYTYHPAPSASTPLDLNTHPPAASYSSRSTTPAPAPGSNLDIVKANRATDEKKTADLKTYISNMEDIQRNQAHPNDLAAVKKSKTPIFAKPSESAQVLMHAESQDEFQVLGFDGPWVHVQISGASRGWMERAQLEMPAGFASSQADAPRPAPFTVSKEETTSFHGDWAPLKGKSVRIEWVEPATPSLVTSRKDKLTFAKAVFLQASEKLPASPQQPDGIVVVFDSIDGGQIAAALPTVQALANHSLSDAAFWHQCSIDPPDSFLDTPRDNQPRSDH
jgi:hypothetical protein